MGGGVEQRGGRGEGGEWASQGVTGGELNGGSTPWGGGEGLELRRGSPPHRPQALGFIV